MEKAIITRDGGEKWKGEVDILEKMWLDDDLSRCMISA